MSSDMRKGAFWHMQAMKAEIRPLLEYIWAATWEKGFMAHAGNEQRHEKRGFMAYEDRDQTASARIHMSSDMRKGALWRIRATKAQIRLRIREVWSRPSLSANWITGYGGIHGWKGWSYQSICRRMPSKQTNLKIGLFLWTNIKDWQQY